MRIVPKDMIRFGVPSEDSAEPAQIEVRLEPDRFGGWRTRATMVGPAPGRRTELTRIFRADDRDVAVGKMVTWIRGRYPRSWPLANRGAASRQCG